MSKITVPIGPQHPLLKEPLAFTLTLEGEHVSESAMRLGYVHRGIERLCQERTYVQNTHLLERVCGICSHIHTTTYCQGVEGLLGLEVPLRGAYLRALLCELERIHSHLLWVGLAGHFLGYNTVFMWAWKYREPVLDLFEMITGNRNSYAMFRVGGVRRDIENSKIPEIRRILDNVKKKTDLLTGAVMDDPVIHGRLKGVGVLTRQDVIDYGAVGPTARASGLAIDVRKDDPYAAYPLVDWKVITAQAGDVFAKAEVRLLEMYESVSIIEQCLRGLEKEKEGEINVKVNEIPEGIGHGRAEAPRGEVFHFVVSDGSNSPVRHKIRAPSYVNIATFKKSCVGQTIADATITLAGVDPCYCCTERLAVVYDANSGERIMNARELIDRSVSATLDLTEKIRRKR